MRAELPAISPAGMQEFLALRPQAIDAVTERFMTEHGATYAALGPRGREACREDLAHHLEFLRPALEFGLLQPMVDYLLWLESVLETRGIPFSHVPLSLDWLAHFFELRMGATGGQAVAGALRAAGATLSQARAEAADPKLAVVSPEIDAFEAALLKGDHREAAKLFQSSMENHGGLVAAAMNVIQPALYRIGQKWQNNEVSVAQEHIATAIAQSVMTRGLIASEPVRMNGRKALLACVAGNHHCVGLHMVADAFLLSGWEVQYLGADVPTDSLVKQVIQWRPDLVGLSASFAHQLPAARAVISLLSDALGPNRPPVLVGGLAIKRFGGLAKRVGADGWSADAMSAVDAAATLQVATS